MVNITLAAAKRGGRIKKDIKSFPGPPSTGYKSLARRHSQCVAKEKERTKERKREGGSEKKEAPEYVVAVGCYFFPFKKPKGLEHTKKKRKNGLPAVSPTWTMMDPTSKVSCLCVHLLFSFRDFFLVRLRLLQVTAVVADDEPSKKNAF